MAAECLVISVLICVLCIGFFRAKRKNWAYAVLPIGFIPFVTGVTMLIAVKIFKYEYTFLLPLTMTLAALAISCIWIGIASSILIKTKRMKIPYLAACVGFNFALSLIILVRYYFETSPAL